MAYLLDTGLLLNTLRNSISYQAIDHQLGLLRGGFQPMASYVSAGEILAIAGKKGWGAKKLSELQQLLQKLVLLPIDRPAIYETYAELAVENEKKGRNVGQNDLWIAATAIEYRLTVLTFDADFERTPTSVRYIRFDQNSGAELSRK